jgi:RecB family endonuclease NucS
MIEKFKEIFLSLDYSVKIDDEKTFQNIIYLVFMVIGFTIDKEHKTNIGRIDAIISYQNSVYIFEFKRDQTAIDAMNQIHEKGYYNKFINTGKNIYLIGINYNTNIREIDDYIIETIDVQG